MTHNSAIHALKKLLAADDRLKGEILEPTERKAITHAIEQLARIEDLEH